LSSAEKFVSTTERYPAKFVISSDVPIGLVVKKEVCMNRFLM